jgi:hypothetical protein
MPASQLAFEAMRFLISLFKRRKKIKENQSPVAIAAQQRLNLRLPNLRRQSRDLSLESHGAVPE